MCGANYILWSWNTEAGLNKLNQIDKASDATELCIIMVTANKEQQIDVDRNSIRVWFGDDVAEDILEMQIHLRTDGK